ncbi:MAG: Carboxy-terminal processing protease CtpB [Alphaproteobacteria bacterium MarineAlpha2_Bin1]|nr:MAG: Carboxy-terminal processing protease CtpB [Alphaproteobacteria bacterium MarineAlpha2_Bin1]
MKNIIKYVVLIVLFSIQVNITTHASDLEKTYKQLDFFGKVFDKVKKNYVDEVSDEKLMEAAINGMLQSLDPHSGYLNEKNFKEMQIQTRGQFGGLGIEVTMEKGFVKIIAPIEDTPAFKAGLKTNDLITHINSKPVQGLTLSQAVEKMRGPVNSKINLTISRPDEKRSFDVEIIRKVIKIASVRGKIEGKSIYIRISSFSEQTFSGLKKEVKKLNEELNKSSNGIILDLRGNPGGLLSQAIKVSDAFLDKGEIVSTRGRRKNDSQRYNARRGDIIKGLPIIVLINSGSASASEIVAGALQDHGRAVIMGTKSFGKGSVQTIMPISGFGALRLTTSLYYTPSGISIQAKGITPDIIVEQVKLNTEDSSKFRSEANLRNHIEVDKKNDKQNSQIKGDLIQDYQLSRALDMLKGIKILNKVN